MDMVASERQALRSSQAVHAPTQAALVLHIYSSEQWTWSVRHSSAGRPQSSQPVSDSHEQREKHHNQTVLIHSSIEQRLSCE